MGSGERLNREHHIILDFNSLEPTIRSPTISFIQMLHTKQVESNWELVVGELLDLIIIFLPMEQWR